MVKTKKAVIGSSEWCALPQLDLPAIKIKIDTGAKTSALHADEVEVIEKEDGTYLRFSVHPIQRNQTVTRICEAKAIDFRYITSSNGSREKRYVIRTDFKIGNFCFTSDVTLTTRYGMKYRMLLGKEALIQGGFLVDVTKDFVQGHIKNPKKLYL